MKKRFFVLFWAFLLFFAALGPAQPDEAAKALEMVKRAYRSLGSLEARFIQTDERPEMGVTVQEEGVLFFTPPDRMKWEYGGKRPHTVGLNGSKVWIYTPSREQAVVQDITSEEMRRGAATFLGGLEEIEEDFTIQSRPTVAGEPIPLEMFPVGEDFPYDRLSVLVQPESGLIERISIFHKLGNITTIAFQDIRTGVSLPADFFEMDFPEGTEIIEP